MNVLRPLRSYINLVVLVIAVVLMPGCSQEKSPGQAVSGRVLVEEQPLHAGRVTFNPLNQTSGPKVTAIIRDGTFQFSPQDGPWPGEFQVLIASTPPDIEAFLNHESHESIRQKAQERHPVIAQEFNSKSKLRATVNRDQENAFEFEVRWKR